LFGGHFSLAQLSRCGCVRVVREQPQMEGLILNAAAREATEESALVWSMRLFLHFREVFYDFGRGQCNSLGDRIHFYLQENRGVSRDLIVQRVEGMKDEIMRLVSDHVARGMRVRLESDFGTLVAALRAGQVAHPHHHHHDRRESFGVVPWVQENGLWYAFMKVEVDGKYWDLKVEPLRGHRESGELNPWTTAVREAREESAGLIRLDDGSRVLDVAPLVNHLSARGRTELDVREIAPGLRAVFDDSLFHIVFRLDDGQTLAGHVEQFRADNLELSEYSTVGGAWISERLASAALSTTKRIGHLRVSQHARRVLEFFAGPGLAQQLAGMTIGSQPPYRPPHARDGRGRGRGYGP
jgi:hypothetical protein